jgi:hypothetical protein
MTTTSLQPHQIRISRISNGWLAELPKTSLLSLIPGEIKEIISEAMEKAVQDGFSDQDPGEFMIGKIIDAFSSPGEKSKVDKDVSTIYFAEFDQLLLFLSDKIK